MKDIAEIDQNFQIKSSPDGCVLRYYPIPSSPFELYGLIYENGKFRRMPDAAAKGVSAGVHGLHRNTAGGRLRFATDSTHIAIDVKLGGVGKMSHFALCGSAGFDLYADGEYRASYLPPFQVKDAYQGYINLDSAEMREITIHFPLYSEVSELWIGLDDTARLCQPAPYRNEPPMVFYGSSITQGGCASRPGNAYPAILTRMLGIDHINLGFTGNAKGEKAMAEYIALLPMSVFIYDYDHNAPDLSHLERTHEAMYRVIREKRPTLPIVMLSRPKFFLTEDDRARRDVIARTYANAIADRDTNVYFLDGPTLMALAENEGTVDGCHPTDFGFYSMARALFPILKDILKL